VGRLSRSEYLRTLLAVWRTQNLELYWRSGELKIYLNLSSITFRPYLTVSLAFSIKIVTYYLFYYTVTDLVKSYKTAFSKPS